MVRRDQIKDIYCNVKGFTQDAWNVLLAGLSDPNLKLDRLKLSLPTKSLALPGPSKVAWHSSTCSAWPRHWPGTACSKSIAYDGPTTITDHEICDCCQRGNGWHTAKKGWERLLKENVTLQSAKLRQSVAHPKQIQFWLTLNKFHRTRAG